MEGLAIAADRRRMAGLPEKNRPAIRLRRFRKALAGNPTGIDMADPYRQIVRDNGITYDSLVLKMHLTLPPALAGIGVGCPGRNLIAQAGGNALYSDPFLKLFFVFTSVASSGTWTWKGSAGGHNLTGLLDSTGDAKTTGECLHFVENLYVLCRAPAPYGLGMNTTEVFIPPKYEGEFGKGFVSAHNGNFINLGSNVIAGPSIAGPPLYSWENHKVLWSRSRDLYFDPCYKTNYQNLADMAMYHYTGKEVFMDSGSSDYGKAFRDGHFAYQAKRDGRYYYFRYRSDAERAGDSRSMEGPLTETEFELRCQRIGGVRVV